MASSSSPRWLKRAQQRRIRSAVELVERRFGALQDSPVAVGEARKLVADLLDLALCCSAAAHMVQMAILDGDSDE